MALTFPLPLADFWNKLTIASMRLSINEAQQIDRTAGGTILKASVGDALWQGEATLSPSTQLASATEIEALVSVLGRAGASFLLYDTMRPHPASDPDGTILSGASPVIAAMESNNREISLLGLPSGYVLTAGDMIGWTYGSSPTRYALHRLVTGVTANVNGGTGLFEVTPFIAPGVSVGASVTLSRPVMKAVLQPNPTYGQRRPVVIPGASFGFSQTMR